MNKSSLFLINKDLTDLPFPKEAFIDTNVILEIFLRRRFSQEWQEFFVQGALKGTDFIYTHHTLREIRNVLNFQIHTKRAKELNVPPFKDKPAWKVLEDSAQYNFSSEVSSTVDAVKIYLDSAGFTFKEVSRTSDMFELESKYASAYDLGPGDAAIAAEMDALGVNSICSNDGGFFSTDDFNVYSPTDKAWKIAPKRKGVLKPYKSIVPQKK
ncbi:PIN domain-containing protein [Bacillus phage B13]|uniref:PIN domain-containing protein n=1 Tax=Bacillus phage B13 TaxID=2969659 RepID=A0A9E7PLE7_9CAUD|nr:PIN domain-containing protein [Bacillus phage B13]